MKTGAHVAVTGAKGKAQILQEQFDHTVDPGKHPETLIANRLGG
jgi:hypothetical protein